MVHRPPDSRLLTSLIVHEKEYGRHLAAVFPQAHAALASLSAYAAASPAGPAQSIVAVVDVLTAANDALQRYHHAIDAWRDQLVALKDLEDDLVGILRDRDILVTRLIKASKSTRDAHRSSRLIATLPSASLSSLHSSNSTAFSTALSASASTTSSANTNVKLAQAQAELRACEAHLVAKEHELDARRIHLAHDGLGARCRALIECGWVWGELGKQGLKALQALGQTDGTTVGVAPRTSSWLATKPLPTPTSTYPSDSSSLTPSQSASQTAARSTVETSHEGTPASKLDHGHRHSPVPEPKAEPEIKSNANAQARTTRTEEDAEDENEQADLTITIPPPHAIAELTVPAVVRSKPPSNSDTPAAERQPSTSSNTTVHAKPTSTPTPRRKGTRGPRRPLSQQITEVSGEGSDDNGPSSASHRNASNTNNVNTNVLASCTPFPVAPSTSRCALGSHDDTSTSSESEFQHPEGPFQVVENDPFEVIRRSMHGISSTAPASSSSAAAAVLLMPVVSTRTTPSAHASVPDVRQTENGVGGDATVFPRSSSGLGFGPGSGLGSTPSPPSKRARRTSMALFGSLRGLFRKPKAKERAAVTEWEDSEGGRASPTPTRARTSGKGKGDGWVTRTDARIRGGRRRGEEDEELVRRTQPVTEVVPGNMARSGSRLRKGRPGASVVSSVSPTSASGSVRGTHDNGSKFSIPTQVSQNARVEGWVTDDPESVGAGAGVGRSPGPSRRGTMRRRKTSVADLRGSDQGHTDGELGWVPPSPLGRVASVSSGRQQEVVPRSMGDPSISVGPSMGSSRRAATTVVSTSRREPGVDASTSSRHRRSASLSLVDAQLAASLSVSMLPSASGETIPSWRKLSPAVEREPSSLSSTTSSQPASPLSSTSSGAFQTPAPSPTQTPLPTLPPSSTPKPQGRRQVVGNGHAYKHVQNQSLMSIVADVTRRDGEREAVSRSFEVPRAPGSVLNEVDGERGVRTGHARSTSSSIGTGDVLGRERERGEPGPSIKAPVPLKSALRNASRTPSPSPASSGSVSMARTTTVAPEGEGMRVARTKEENRDQERGRTVTVSRSSWRDSTSTSVSSYETGRESLSDEVELPSPPSSPPPTRPRSPPMRSRPRSHSPLRPELSFTFPPPPVNPPAPAQASKNPKVVGSMLASSSVSTETGAVTGTTPTRRKSVRMSLQPTFSPTPPALYDEDGEGYAPWSASFSMRDEAGDDDGLKQKKKKGGAEEDVWADSSEEEEVYGRAKRLLSLVGAGTGAGASKGKGKGKARG